MEHPSLSVVLPVYNGERYLAQAIESVLAQSYRDLELIIINDGSTDRSAEIIATYASQDPRVRVHNQPNQGLIKSLNQGLQIARAPWVARQDADDVSLPNRLSRQMAYLEKNRDVAALGTGVRIIGADGTPSRTIIYPTLHEQICDAFLSGNALAHGSVILSRDHALASGGYDPSAVAIEDYDLWARLARKHRLANLPEVLYLYRKHDAGESTRKNALQRESTRELSARIASEGWFTTNTYTGRPRWFHLPDELTDAERSEARAWIMRSHLLALRSLVRAGQWNAIRDRVLAGLCEERTRYLTGLVNALHDPLKLPGTRRLLSRSRRRSNRGGSGD